QYDRSQRVPVYLSAGSSVLLWAVEVPKGVLGLWFVCGIDLYLPPALPREWKRTAAVLLAFYVRSLSRFYLAGRHWQISLVQSILSSALGFDTFIYCVVYFYIAMVYLFFMF